MNRAFLIAAALVLAPLPALGQQTQQPQDQPQPSPTANQSDSPRDERGGAGQNLLERLSQSDLRDRLSTAVDRIRESCGDDIDQFCDDVTPGGGRIAACVRAYEDQLSLRCRLTLRRTVNRVQQSIVAAISQARDGGASQDRQTQPQQSRQQGQPQQEQGSQRTQQAQIAGQQGAAGQETAALKGQPVFSSDGKNLGQVIQVERSPDGKILSVQIQVGRLLGLGERTITIDGSRIEQLGDRIRTLLSADQIRQLPEAGNDQGAQR